MIKLSSLFVAFSLAMTASVAASAQAPLSATLRVDQGSIMTSRGGEFVTAQTGQVVVTGNRLMVAADSAATVVYSDGCERQYVTPGVYTIVASCTRGGAVAGTATGFDAAGAAAIVGGGLGVAAILSSMDESDERPPPPPVSR